MSHSKPTRNHTAQSPYHLESQDKILVGASESSFDSDASSDEQVDGGYGWLVCFGAFCAQFITFGIFLSWGIMQEYFHKNIFIRHPHAITQLSFVLTLAVFCTHILCPIVQIGVARFGLRPVLMLGTLLIVVSLETAALATQIWQLYLTQGLLFGTGASCMYATVLFTTPQWFKRRRAVALGIVSSGAAMGGLVFPFIVTTLNKNMGSTWTYRIVGCICLLLDSVACIFVKERVQHGLESKRRYFDFNVLKDRSFLLFCIAADITVAGYLVPIAILPANATHLGLSNSQGSSCVSVCCAMSFIGRVTAGAIADVVGGLNSFILFNVITVLACFVIWPLSNTFGTLMAFSVVYGFASGTYFALMSPITSSILGMERLQTGVTVLLVSNAPFFFGSTVAAAIDARIEASPFLVYKMFAGFAYLVGTLLLVILKMKLGKKHVHKSFESFK